MCDPFALVLIYQQPFTCRAVPCYGEMDRPAVATPLPTHLISDSPSDHESELSDPPEDLDEMAVSLEADFETFALDSPGLTRASKGALKRKSTALSTLDVDSMGDASDTGDYRSSLAKKQKLANSNRSSFEQLATEVR